MHQNFLQNKVIKKLSFSRKINSAFPEKNSVFPEKTQVSVFQEKTHNHNFLKNSMHWNLGVCIGSKVVLKK